MKTILIADDNPAICRILSQYGKKEGYRVLTARDGQEALALFEKHEVSVILLDIMMPGISGVELCRRIRRTSDVPILMVTARTSDRDRIAGLDEGADDYIVKPFSPGEVMARIRAVLRRADKNAANDHCPSYAHQKRGRALVDAGLQPRPDLYPGNPPRPGLGLCRREQRPGCGFLHQASARQAGCVSPSRFCYQNRVGRRLSV